MKSDTQYAFLQGIQGLSVIFLTSFKIQHFSSEFCFLSGIFFAIFMSLTVCLFNVITQTVVPVIENRFPVDRHQETETRCGSATNQVNKQNNLFAPFSTEY